MALGKTLGDLEAGDVFTPVEFTLTPLMCTEYAHGLEDTHEWYHSADNELGRQIMPPTMIHAAKMALLEANCDEERRIAGVHTDDARIHYEYHSTQHSLAYVGERLIISGEIMERYVKRGREYIRYSLTLKTSDGRLVSTYTDRTLLRYRPAGAESEEA